MQMTDKQGSSMVDQSHNKHIAIIGCGWLGQALVPKLLAQQVYVTATTTNPEKLDLLTSLGGDAQLLSLLATDHGETSGQMCTPEANWLAAVDTMVISIPPKFKQGSMAYPDHVAQLVKLAEQYQAQADHFAEQHGYLPGLSGSSR